MADCSRINLNGNQCYELYWARFDVLRRQRVHPKLYKLICFPSVPVHAYPLVTRRKLFLIEIRECSGCSIKTTRLDRAGSIWNLLEQLYMYKLCTYQCQAGGNLIDRFGPGVGLLNYLAVPGVGIFEFLTKNHFLGWGISVIFDLTFLPGGREFDSSFWEKVKIPPYAPPPSPPAWHW